MVVTASHQVDGFLGFCLVEFDEAFVGCHSYLAATFEKFFGFRGRLDSVVSPVRSCCFFVCSILHHRRLLVTDGHRTFWWGVNLNFMSRGVLGSLLYHSPSSVWRVVIVCWLNVDSLLVFYCFRVLFRVLLSCCEHVGLIGSMNICKACVGFQSLA